MSTKIQHQIRSKKHKKHKTKYPRFAAASTNISPLSSQSGIGSSNYETDETSSMTWSDSDIHLLLDLYETHMHKLRSAETVKSFWDTIAMRMQQEQQQANGFHVSAKPFPSAMGSNKCSLKKNKNMCVAANGTWLPHQMADTVPLHPLWRASSWWTRCYWESGSFSTCLYGNAACCWQLFSWISSTTFIKIKQSSLHRFASRFRNAIDDEHNDQKRKSAVAARTTS